MDPIGRPSPALGKMFEPFRAFLYEAAGIYFQDHNRDRLLGHVAERMKILGKSDPADYLAFLRASRGARSELWEFFNQVTVNETYFFREPQQFDVLRDRVLPQLIKRRQEEKREKIVIWSAACSSGEEAYSLAILLKECFPGELASVKILGFDISSEVVDKAMKADYSEYSVRTCSEKQKTSYFKRVGNNYQLVPYIKRLATFQVVNLIDQFSLKALSKPDLILCRNVLIYFDKESKAKALKNLGNSMLLHAYLFLSQTETLFNIDHPFDLVHFFKASAYKLKP